MSNLFEQSGDMKKDLFEYLEHLFDREKISENAELIRQVEIEAEIKQIQADD